MDRSIYAKPVEPGSEREAYVQRVLGDEPMQHASKILAEVDNKSAIVTQSAFRHQVIPLLEKLFVTEARIKYLQVSKDIQLPLRVVADDDHTRVIHVVPPLFCNPMTTIPQPGKGLTVGEALSNLNRFRDLNRVDLVDSHTKFYLEKVTILPNLVKDILIPIDLILQEYGTSIDISATNANPEGRDALPQITAKADEVAPTISTQATCFSEEEDED
jgi:hypothetical protein